MEKSERNFNLCEGEKAHALQIKVSVTSHLFFPSVLLPVFMRIFKVWEEIFVVYFFRHANRNFPQMESHIHVIYIFGRYQPFIMIQSPYLSKFHIKPSPYLTRNTICNLFLYIFFWVFSRRQIKFCRRFGTLCQVYLQRLEKYPKENIQDSEHGENLKSRICNHFKGQPISAVEREIYCENQLKQMNCQCSIFYCLY
jgi:hypothetical protein